MSAIVAPVERIPYAEASRVLLRDSVLDAMRDLLLTRDWSAITLSDRVVLLDGGRIVASGPHEELLASEPLYAEILAHGDDNGGGE